ncbi:hypothetical protein TRIP_D310130 [uncultured Paludibacter sp.]|nr:hypothetical protein TRIP_D310130 [uncultured Paludibacter sp.]
MKKLLQSVLVFYSFVSDIFISLKKFSTIFVDITTIIKIKKYETHFINIIVDYGGICYSNIVAGTKIENE